MNFLKVPIKIAIVDDDKVTLGSYKAIFKNIINIECHYFDKAEEALKELQKAKDFALLISDIDMPTLPGEQLVEEVVRLKLGLDIVIVTGSNSSIKTLPCVMLGARELIHKPLQKTELTQAVQRSVDRVYSIINFYKDLSFQKITKP